MASIVICPESEKKKLSNIFSNATAEMLESNYSIKVLPHMKDYRVVIQDFVYEKAIIGADKITKNSKFIFYDPDHRRDRRDNIIFYNVKGEIIDSIKIREIRYADGYKKLKILKDKPYEEKAFPAKYGSDILEKETGNYSDDKLLLSKKGKKIHHIKNYKKHYYYYNKYIKAVGDFMGITLFNAALKKVGLYRCTTEYTIVKDESGKFYFDSTDARDDESWKYIEYRKIKGYSSGIIQDIEYRESIDLNLLKVTTMASALRAYDIGPDAIGDESYYRHICKKYARYNMTFDCISIRNTLQFVDDKDNYHTKYIDLNMLLSNLRCDNYKIQFDDRPLRVWYVGYICNKDKFSSTDCREAIFDAFRAIIELDVIGELQAIKPVINIEGGLYDIKVISKTISSNISNMCEQIKSLATMKVDPLYEKEWQEFCGKTNFNSEVVKLSEELKHKYAKKQASFLAAPTESETIDTTDTYRSNEQDGHTR